MAEKNTLTIRLVKSPIGAKRNHIACVRGLGLTRLGQQREVLDTPAIRGMINTVRHLVKIIR
ncbi:MAG: 50S ribosomal protein L30 [Casimicrobiaceae bacterium]|nr:50S ribosomal protein L30 [Casimicrobiaceae bacterium]MCX8097548.1 50S ribosomal protein L30 [Casimicrobiaceae bacterium]MDW8312856.1 50S ribosomal protein L30 [Burkholderiales bacterium]